MKLAALSLTFMICIIFFSFESHHNKDNSSSISHKEESSKTEATSPTQKTMAAENPGLTSSSGKKKEAQPPNTQPSRQQQAPRDISSIALELEAAEAEIDAMGGAEALNQKSLADDDRREIFQRMHGEITFVRQECSLELFGEEAHASLLIERSYLVAISGGLQVDLLDFEIGVSRL